MECATGTIGTAGCGTRCWHSRPSSPPAIATRRSPFRGFLLRAATGDPAALQIMYGIGGERRLTEFELPHLPGYEGSKPVRVGNAASEQFQLDVYGEVIGVLAIGVEAIGEVDERLWTRWRGVVEYLETIWRLPDDGIWEARGPQHHYTYLEGDGLGRVRPRREGRRALRAGGADRSLGAGPRRENSRRVCEKGYEDRGAADLHPGLRIEGARRQRPQHPHSSASCPGPTIASPAPSTRFPVSLGGGGFVLALFDRRDRRRVARR